MNMVKRWLAALLAMIVLSPAALAEVYEGKTAPLTTVTVCAESGGVVETAAVSAGGRVGEGEPLFQMKPEKTFATQDGTVSMINVEPGDTVSGEVLALMPVERYTLYCTVDSAYQSAASTLIHSGETVYIKCTADGTHRAIGTVAQIDGSEYRVYTFGGELYVGETVYLYRGADFTSSQRVGIGTVVVSDTQSYEAEGVLTQLRVSEGDAVERGQLLYAVDGGAITAPVSGIVTSMACQPGDTVEDGQAVAELVPDGEVGVEIQVDETAAARISVGDAALLTLAGWEDDPVPGTIVSVSAIAESDSYAVRLRPETDRALPLGMSVEVRL